MYVRAVTAFKSLQTENLMASKRCWACNIYTNSVTNQGNCFLNFCVKIFVSSIIAILDILSNPLTELLTKVVMSEFEVLQKELHDVL